MFSNSLKKLAHVSGKSSLYLLAKRPSRYQSLTKSRLDFRLFHLLPTRATYRPEVMGVAETGNPALDQAIQNWLEWDKNEKTSREIQALMEAKDYPTLSRLLLKRLDFGTAGLRGRMGAGFAQMNDLVVIQTAQGLLHYLLESFADTKEHGIVVGYDGRHHSKRFAELTAAVFVAASVPVRLFSAVCPTPFVPFGLTHFRCVAGVMVTASHNPKQDNGYKVYWRNGAQIISPVDKGIAAAILKNLEPRQSSWDTISVRKNALVSDGLDVVTEKYIEKLPLLKTNRPVPSSAAVYTPMHGVGWKYIQAVFAAAGYPEPIPVDQQRDPDPEFPTVKFPNPEEGRSALDFSILRAEEAGCNLILANDPDADRLAVAEQNDGDWKVFTGNELGALLGWWMWHCYLEEEGPNADVKHVHMLSSTVSSKILKTMSKKHGFCFQETLTGFKWMGNITHDLIQKGERVLFAFEEAIGFMCGVAVIDKDGVSAAVKVAEMTAYLATQGMNLSDKLRDIYSTYGHHITQNSYFVCHQPEVLRAIFHRLRNFEETTDQSYPKSLKNGQYKITEIRDLTTGFDSSTVDQKATLPSSKSSEMLTFTFENGLVATLRTSGTEPKVKYYTELCADPQIQDLNELNNTLKDMIDGIIEEFLEPTKNGLLPREN